MVLWEEAEEAVEEGVAGAEEEGTWPDDLDPSVAHAELHFYTFQLLILQ